jgi:hypothetical protein
VLWDPQRQVLWALGGDKLVQLHVGGSTAAPTLTAVAIKVLPVPYGHDVEPKYGDSAKLWITAGGSTWVYEKTTGQATRYQGVAGYKSINNLAATGQVIETRPHASCKQNGWCTDVIEFIAPDEMRTRPHAAVYRARLWRPEYQ